MPTTGQTKATILLGDFFNEVTKLSPCIDLAIIDGEYYKVKGNFDYKFKSFEDWQYKYERIAKATRKVMSPTGTVVVWGHAKKVAYQQVIFDKCFTLLSSCVWEKIDCQTRRSSPVQSRRFIPVTERFLVYSVGSEQSERYPYNSRFDEIRLHLRECFEQVKQNTDYTSNDQIAKLLGLTGRMISHWIAKSQWEFIAENRYTKLQKLFPNYFPKNYQSLKAKYLQILDGVQQEREQRQEPARRYFDNTKYKLTDVIRHRQESEITRRYPHPTQKPPGFCKILIETMSRKGDNILVPFGGSGGEIEQALRLGRNVFATEINEKYYSIIKSRVDRINPQY